VVSEIAVMADENFMVAQLKATLKQLNLPQLGKATLRKRLLSHDPSGNPSGGLEGIYASQEAYTSSTDESGR